MHTSEDILAQLGFCSSEQKISLRDPTFVTDFFQWMLVKDPKSKREELWVALQEACDDLDRLFMSMAHKQLRGLRHKPHDEEIEDMVQDALMQIVTKETIRKWNGSNPVKYFVGMFQKRMINEMKKWVNTHAKETQVGDEDVLDLMDGQVDDYDPVANYVGLDKLIEGLSKYFRTKPSSKQDWLLELLQWTVEGHSITDIAKMWGISKGTASKRSKEMGRYIAEYANKTDNELLKALLEKYAYGYRKYAQEREADDWASLFEDYDKKRTALTKKVRKASLEYVRTDSGKKIKQVSIRKVYDPHNPDLYSNNASYSSQSEEALKANRDNAIEECNAHEDVLDLGGGVLAVITSMTGTVIEEPEPELLEEPEVQYIEEPLKEILDYGLDDGVEDEGNDTTPSKEVTSEVGDWGLDETVGFDLSQLNRDD